MNSIRITVIGQAVVPVVNVVLGRINVKANLINRGKLGNLRTLTLLAEASDDLLEDRRRIIAALCQEQAWLIVAQPYGMPEDIFVLSRPSCAFHE